MIVFLGLMFIVLGIGWLAFPGLARSINRFSNEWKGVETKHGEMFEVGRMVSGIGMIIVGFIILIGP